MPSKRILVLDDEPNIGGSLRLILEREGYSVTLARSIAEAKPAAERADLLLLDVRLPDGSGIEFLRQAPQIGIVTRTTPYPLAQANQALADLRAGRFEGAAVLVA